MLLQNLQLVVRRRYENEERRGGGRRPMFSVVLDEFAPFGYNNFTQILQTARGTNTAFLFSMQSLPQLMRVGRSFKEEVSSAPNTTITMRTRDEETARYFLRASAEHVITRRSRTVERWKLFGYEKYEDTGRAVESQDRETPVDVKTAAGFLGVSPSLVYAWVERKQIPHFRIMGRAIRFSIPELAQWRQQFHVNGGIDEQ